MMRRAISPRLATRTLESNGSVGAWGLDGGQINRRRAPAVLTGGPAAHEHDGAIRTLEPQFQQALMSHPRERHDLVAVHLSSGKHGQNALSGLHPRDTGLAQTLMIVRDQRIRQPTNARFQIGGYGPRGAAALQPEEP